MARVCALGELTWEEVAALAQAKALVMLPVGALEAHGPHLPLATDVLIAEETARRAGAHLTGRGVDVVLAPTLTYAVTEYARSFAGTVSLRPETAAAVLTDVCTGLIEHGFERLVLVNGHLEPAHIRILRRFVSEVAERTGVSLCFPDNTRRRWVPRFSPEFQSGDAHAGRYETSLVLAARPELVRDETRQALPPVELNLVEKMREGAESFSEIGAEAAYFGRPADASAAHGNEQYDRLVEMVLTEIAETYPDLSRDAG